MPKGVHNGHSRGSDHYRYKGRHVVCKTAIYRAWRNMRSRCNTPEHPDYSRYGGRGIAVCEAWDDFDTFAADMGPHPGPGWTLDRKDNNGGYNKRNCRWATRKTQSRNRGAYNKISMATAEAIRAMYATGEYRQIDVAAQFGVSQVDVSQITRNARWAA